MVRSATRSRVVMFTILIVENPLSRPLSVFRTLLKLIPVDVLSTPLKFPLVLLSCKSLPSPLRSRTARRIPPLNRVPLNCTLIMCLLILRSIALPFFLITYWLE